MPRSTNATVTKKRRKKVLNATKGFFGNKSRLFRYAKDALQRSRKYSYRDRRKKKSNFRKLWIIRINAACREHGINYSTFFKGIKLLNININRKMISELEINEKSSFLLLLSQVKHILLNNK